jgi:hypothetical protein
MLAAPAATAGAAGLWQAALHSVDVVHPLQAAHCQWLHRQVLLHAPTLCHCLLPVFFFASWCVLLVQMV